MWGSLRLAPMMIAVNCMQRRRTSVYITSLKSMDTSKPKIVPVPRECNMIDFAKENIDNYDPDSGKGYYQFIMGVEEYISPKTRVVLVNEDEQQICTGHKARKVIGVSDKREKVKLPDLSKSGWKYVFIQSTSRIRTLSGGMFFMYCDKLSDEVEPRKDEDKSLKLVDDKHKTLTRVPGDREYSVIEFAKTIKGVSNYNPGLGYGFYEFTKPELISYEKQVILMDKNEKLYYGPGARYEIDIGPGRKYDEAVEIKPKFDGKKWMCVFVQTRSNVRKLQPGSRFLYCNVASSEIIRILEPFKIVDVPEVSEDGRKLIKFAKKNITHYNPRAGYAYYEFTKCGYVLPERNVMALKKNGELFTGPGVRQLLGAAEDYDGTEEIYPPKFGMDEEWDCLFIQGKAYGRLLEPNTRFLYCEYDYKPEVY